MYTTNKIKIKDNIANILTIARMVMLPLMIALFYLEPLMGAVAMWICFVIYIIAAITDFLDGYLARKLDQITPFGTFLDPISDKIFVATLLVLLVAFDKVGGIGTILVILIFAREFLVSGLREFLSPKNIQMPVTKLAKWKTTVQMIGSGILILSGTYPNAYGIGITLLFAATMLTLITGKDYLVEGMKHMKK